jgi:hypothetical protein
MKPSFLSYFILLVTSGLLFFGCSPSGPSKEQLAADSIRRPDSIAKVDSIAKAEAMAAETVANDLNSKTNAPKNRNFIKTAQIKFRVKHVRSATEKIEDFTASFQGYVKYSSLTNHTENFSTEKISKDSSVESRLIIVENQMVLRIPHEKLDSLLRAMNALIVFLDYRTYNMDDVTSALLRNINDATRIKKYSQRQTGHIDTKPSKLKETTQAEESLLDKQKQADDLLVTNKDLEEQVKYATVNLLIYQKPVIVRDVIANFGEYDSYRPSFFSRIAGSTARGWYLLSTIIVFIFNLWGILLLIVLTLFIYRFISRNKIFSKKQE